VDEETDEYADGYSFGEDIGDEATEDEDGYSFEEDADDELEEDEVLETTLLMLDAGTETGPCPMVKFMYDE